MRLRCVLAAMGLLPVFAVLAQVPPKGPGLPPSPAEVRAAATLMTPEEAGRQAEVSFRTRYPDLLKGRVVLGWDPRVPAAVAAGRAAAAADSNLRLLSDLGVAADGPAQALTQLDPSTFSGILWIEILRAPSGEPRGVTLVFRASGRTEEKRLEVFFSQGSPSPSPPKSSPTPAPAPESLFKLQGTFSAAAWSGSGDEVWLLAAGRLLRRSLMEGKDLQEWPLSQGGSPSETCALRLFFEVGSPTRLGIVTDGRGTWFAQQGQEFRPGGAFEGYPLSEKEARFVRAPWLSDENAYALLDYQGRELARFLDLSRIRTDAGESLLVLLKKDRSLSAFRGNSLETVPAPGEGAFSAIAGWRDRFAASEATTPHRVRVFRGTGNSSWEPLWISDSLPGSPLALCIGQLGEDEVVLAFLQGVEGTVVQVLRLPRPAPAPAGR